MSIKEVCTCEPITISKESSIQEAAILMKKHNVGSIIVVNNIEKNSDPCGILTDRDIVIKLVADNLCPTTLCVCDVMSQDLLIVKESANISEVMKEMSMKGTRRVPVVDDTKKVVGLVSVDDLILFISRRLEAIACLIEKQIE